VLHFFTSNFPILVDAQFCLSLFITPPRAVVITMKTVGDCAESVFNSVLMLLSQKKKEKVKKKRKNIM